MKLPILTLLALMIFNTISCAQSLILCTYPNKSNQSIYMEYKPLLTYLEKELQQKVTLTIAKDYNNQIELLLSGKAHIAILGPYNYIKAKKANKQIDYIATQQHLQFDTMISSYQSIIITLKKSNISDLQQLKGKRFGFTDFNSNSGYLVPNLILQENKIDKKDFSEYFMLKKHTHIMEAINRNSIDAGATHYDNYLKYRKKYGNIYTILYKSKPIPFDAVVVSPFVSKDLKKSIQKAFLSFTVPLKGQNISGYKLLDENIYKEIKNKAKKLQ